MFIDEINFSALNVSDNKKLSTLILFYSLFTDLIVSIVFIVARPVSMFVSPAITCSSFATSFSY
jgi:hypothetical protein